MNLGKSGAFSGGALTITSGAAGYYAFEYETVTSQTQLLSLSILGAGDCYGHRAAPNIYSQLPAINSIRLLSQSILISNQASMTNIEGTIFAAQFPQDEQWWNQTASSAIAVARESYRGRLATGLYAFIKPTSVNDFRYLNNISQIGGVITNASFDLLTPGDFVAVHAETVAVGATYPGMDLLMTHALTLEFTTENQWYEAELCPMTTASRQAAMDKMGPIPQFYENPLHLSDMAKYLRAGFNHVRKHASAIGATLSTLFPQFAPIFASVSTALQT